MPRINVTSVLVDDQATALEFYTSKLGFVTKNDVSLPVVTAVLDDTCGNLIQLTSTA